MKNQIMSRTISVHQEHEVLTKLESAGLNSELAQKIVNSPSNETAKAIISYLRGGDFVSPSKLFEFDQDIELSSVEKFYAMGVGNRMHYSGNFEKHFNLLVEENVPACKLKSFRLKRDSPDTVIIAAMGGNHEIKIAHVAQLIKKQPNCEHGLLDEANMFYIRDATSQLRSVQVLWSGGVWGFHSNFAPSDDEWDAGYRVFSY